MHVRRILYILPVLLLATACDTSPVFPVEPAITFESITPSAATQFTADEIVLKFHYQDGDGDLGYEGDAVNNLFITDTRAAFAGNPGRITSYAIQSLTPDTRNPSIQGEITVTMMTPPYHPDEEPLIFEVYIVDRAGHQSNTVRTTPITVQQ